MTSLCPSCKRPLEIGNTILAGDSSLPGNSCHHCGEEISQILSVDSASVEVESEVAGNGLEPTNIGLTTEDSQQAARSGSSLPPQDSHPNSIGHFKLQSVLGTGAFGQVWLAEDTNLGRPVALKLPKLAEKDPQLLHEAQTAARLTHPGIVAVYEVGEVKGQIYIASEYIKGETLRDEFQRGRPQVVRTVDVIANVAHALHYAHEQGVVHRDIKPANIMVDEQKKPHIADFGIAKSVSADDTISLDGEIVGTIAYMAPEQATGQNQQTDRRADIYALGVMLFELLTEYRPFRGNAEGVLIQKKLEEAPSPRTLVPTLSRDLETICLKCLERDAERRYATARELAEELERFQQNIPIQARPVSRIEKGWRWCRRNPTIAGLLTAVIVSLTLGLLSTSYFAVKAEENAGEMRRALYRARMNLVPERLVAGDIVGGQQLLAAYENSSPNEDLREFGWHYYQSKLAPIQQVVNHGEKVEFISLSYDGKHFATAGKRGQIRVWKSEDGSLVRTLGRAGQALSGIDFSPADDRLLTASTEGVLRVWNPVNHDHVAFELDHAEPITVARFSPDRRHIASGGATGTVKLWNVADRKMISDGLSMESGSTNQPILDLAFSADSKRLVVLAPASDRKRVVTQTSAVIWNVATQEKVCTLPSQVRGSALDFDATGEHVFVISQTGMISKYNSADGAFQNRKASPVPYGGIDRLGQTNYMTVTDLDGRTSVLNHDLDTVYSIVTHSQSFGVVDCHPDGRTLVVGSGDGTAKLISLTPQTDFRTGWRPQIARSVAWLKSEEAIAVADANGALMKWRPGASEFQQIIPPDDRNRPLLSVCVNPVSGDIFACGMMRSLFVVDADSGEVKEYKLPAGGHDMVCCSADGQLLAIASRFGAVSVYQTSDLSTPVFDFSRESNSITALDLSASGWLAVGFSDGELSLINPLTEVVVDDLPTPRDVPQALSFDERGEHLVVGTKSGYLQFLSLAEKQFVAEAKGHSGLINAVEYLPSGQLVTAGLDRSLKIWDTSSLELVTVLTGHAHQVLCLCRSTDGASIVSSGIDGDVRVWHGRGGR